MIKQACIFWWTGLKCIWIYLFLFSPLIFQNNKNKWGGLGPPRQGLLLGLSGLAHRISMVPGVPKHEDPEAMWHMPVCSGQFQIHSFWSLTEEGEILTQCHSASDILEVNRALCVLMAVNSRSVQGLSRDHRLSRVRWNRAGKALECAASNISCGCCQFQTDGFSHCKPFSLDSGLFPGPHAHGAGAVGPGHSLNTLRPECSVTVPPQTPLEPEKMLKKMTETAPVKQRVSRAPGALGGTFSDRLQTEVGCVKYCHFFSM